MTQGFGVVRVSFRFGWLKWFYCLNFCGNALLAYFVVLISLRGLLFSDLVVWSFVLGFSVVVSFLLLVYGFCCVIW